MNEQILETIKQLEIKKAPEEQSLEAANQSYTKDQLAHFIERHELSIAKSWKKAEIVTALTEWMNEAQTKLLHSKEDLLSSYYEELVQSEQSRDVYNASLSDSELERILLLIEHGLVFNVDGQLWIPDETVKAVTELVESNDLVSNSKKTEAKEKTEEITTQSESPKKKSTQTIQQNQRAQSTSSFSSSKERVAQQKQQRLDYLKTLAKKKKRKKRK